MIFISDNDLTIKTQRLRGGYQPGGECTFILHNAMTNSVSTVTVEDEGDEYVMSFTIPEGFAKSVTSGEYVWSVQDNEYRVVATGVARKKETRFEKDTVYSHVESDTEYIGIDTTTVYHTVSISASLGCYLIVDGQQCQTYNESVPEGTILDVEAVPEEHYRFVIWSDGVEESERQLVVDDDISIDAVAEADMYNVSVSAGDDGWLYVDGVWFDNFSEAVPFGSQLMLEILPFAGFRFTGWSDGDTENPRYLDVKSDIDLSAAYEADTYHVTVTAGEHCSVSVNNVPGDFEDDVQSDTVLSIVATPDTGYNFVNWSDGNAASHRSLLVTRDISLTTVTQLQTFMVNIMTSDNQQGLVVVNGTPGDYISQVGYGTVLNLSAQPLGGFEFHMWSDGNTSNQRTVTVTDNVTLRALFQEVAPVQPNDEIWYTSTDGQPVTLYAENFGSGVTVLSNTYAGGKGVVKLSGDATEIGANDFRNCQTLFSVKLPDSVTRIGTRAFANSGVSSVDFGNGVTSVLDNAFDGCQSLVSVAIPDTVTSLGTNVFIYCSGLETVVIGSGVTTLTDNVFRSCSSLLDVKIPDNVTSTGIGTFRYSGLASVTFGSELAAIGNYSFADAAGLASITFTSTTTVPTLGTNAFNNVASTGTVYGVIGLDYSTIMAALPAGWILSLS